MPAFHKQQSRMYHSQLEIRIQPQKGLKNNRSCMSQHCSQGGCFLSPSSLRENDHLVLFLWLISWPFQCEQHGLILSPTLKTNCFALPFSSRIRGKRSRLAAWGCSDWCRVDGNADNPARRVTSVTLSAAANPTQPFVVSRCIFTTVDPETGIIAKKEPLETLKRWGFNSGSLRLGDDISVSQLYYIVGPLFIW